MEARLTSAVRIRLLPTRYRRRRGARGGSLTPVPRPRRRNPWTSTGEILLWLLFIALLFPAGFAGWAVGHYTSLGKSPSTVVKTVTVGGSGGSTAAGTTTSAGTSTQGSATTTGKSTGNSVVAGKSVFLASGCGSCHTFKPAGSTGTIGPNLATAIPADAKADHNMALPQFISQSITDPNAYVAKGYNQGIMPSTFGKQLTSTQLNELVAFVLSGVSK
jgi:mono/diheme cytochrome c family protein